MSLNIVVSRRIPFPTDDSVYSLPWCSVGFSCKGAAGPHQWPWVLHVVKGTFTMLAVPRALPEAGKPVWWQTQAQEVQRNLLTLTAWTQGSQAGAGDRLQLVTWIGPL